VDFVDNLTKWSEIIRKTFAEGAIDDIVSTRRLVDIVEAYAVFNDKKKVLKLSLSRFDGDTQETFLNLYDKVDADTDFNADDAGDTETPATAEGNECPF
jgi:hypothetical protein